MRSERVVCHEALAFAIASLEGALGCAEGGHIQAAVLAIAEEMWEALECEDVRPQFVKGIIKTIVRASRRLVALGR